VTDEPKTGAILWTDLTVPNADEIRDFYSRVTGWRAEPVKMGDYSDYNMIPAEGTEPAAGICFARGPNENLPAQWLIYVTVASLDESIKRCLEQGGKIVDGPRGMGKQRFCVIQDPAGAYAGLGGD